MVLQLTTVVFGLLSVVGVLSTYFTSVIFIALAKHKKDRAPLTYFMLKPEASVYEIKLFILPAVAIFLVGVFTLLQKLAGTPSTSNPTASILFYMAYIFGLFTILALVYVEYRWYRHMKRFL